MLKKVSVSTCAQTMELIEMTTRTRKVLSPPERVKYLLALGLGAVALVRVGAPVLADQISRRQAEFQEALYQELHPGEVTTFFEFGGFHEWAKKEEKRLEPIVLEILRGEREGVPWSHAVSFVARDIPTKAICDEVFTRMESTLAEQRVDDAPLTDRAQGALIGLLSVLAEGDDTRAMQPLNELVQSIRASRYAHITGRKCLIALRRVGDKTSLEALREMPLRKTNERIDRAAGLTEKIIEARVQGKAFPPETAPEELRAVAQRFLKACDAENLHAYAACFPWGFHEVFDHGDMQEFLRGEHGPGSLAAIRAALNANVAIEIDQEKLQAKLLCDDRYVMEFVYEVDGWKVMNVRPLRTSRADPPPPVVYPDNKDGKRILIGKPGKDSAQH